MVVGTADGSGMADSILPFGSVPVTVMDGFFVAISSARHRYLNSMA